MATTSVKNPQPSPLRLQFSQTATAVTSDCTINVQGVKRLFVHLTVATADLNSFAISAKATADATAATLFSTSGHYTSPAGRLKGASADLTTLSQGTGWFDIDTEGLDVIILNPGSAGAATLAVEAGGW